MSLPLEYESGHATPRLPMAVAVIAWLYVSVGILAAFSMGWALGQGQAGLNFNVLAVLVGWGLLRRNQGWRACAVVLGWLGIIASVLLAVLAVIYGDRLYARINGQVLNLAPAMEVAIALALSCQSSFTRKLVRMSPLGQAAPSVSRPPTAPSAGTRGTIRPPSGQEASSFV